MGLGIVERPLEVRLVHEIEIEITLTNSLLPSASHETKLNILHSRATQNGLRQDEIR